MRAAAVRSGPCSFASRRSSRASARLQGSRANEDAVMDVDCRSKGSKGRNVARRCRDGRSAGASRSCPSPHYASAMVMHGSLQTKLTSWLHQHKPRLKTPAFPAGLCKGLVMTFDSPRRHIQRGMQSHNVRCHAWLPVALFSMLPYRAESILPVQTGKSAMRSQCGAVSGRAASRGSLLLCPDGLLITAARTSCQPLSTCALIRAAR